MSDPNDELAIVKIGLAGEFARIHAEVGIPERREVAVLRRPIDPPSHATTVHVTPAMVLRVIAALEAEVERLRAAVQVLRRATTDSCVTGGEYGGPGCFFCDTEDGHTPDCDAAAALAALDKKESTDDT